jgi:hypothetical protein
MKRIVFIVVIFLSFFILYSYSEGASVGRISEMRGSVLYKEKSIAPYQKAEKGMALEKV